MSVAEFIMWVAIWVTFACVLHDPLKRYFRRLSDVLSLPLRYVEKRLRTRG